MTLFLTKYTKTKIIQDLKYSNVSTISELDIFSFLSYCIPRNSYFLDRFVWQAYGFEFSGGGALCHTMVIMLQLIQSKNLTCI